MYPEDETVKVKTCRDNDEFRLISRTCTVINCPVMRNKNVQNSILGKSDRNLNHSLPSVQNDTIKTFSFWLNRVALR